MPCFHPRRVWYDVEGGRPAFRQPWPGSRRWTEGTMDCKRCRGCLAKYAGEWAVRCVHEAKLHARNCFVTLTYDQAHVPLCGSLRKADLAAFMKRLRRRFPGVLIRFFACGEYGKRTHRPHYHVCLFGLDFDDAIPLGRSQSGEPMCSSAILSEVWGMGIATVQEMTRATAEYTASYVLKKLESLHQAEQHEWWMKKPALEREFINMSRRPGIGRAWLERYHGDVFKRDATSKALRDQVVLIDDRKGARELPAPGYYLRVLREWSEDDYLDVKESRTVSSVARLADSLPARLEVREECAAAAVRNRRREAF